MVANTVPEGEGKGGPKALRRHDTPAPHGKVSLVSGSVVAVTFPRDRLPEINNALAVDCDGPHKLVVEV